MTAKERIIANVSVRLKNHMAQYNLSQRRMANALGISQAALNNYISGRRVPPAELIPKIANVLDCRLADLLRTEN